MNEYIKIDSQASMPQVLINEIRKHRAALVSSNFQIFTTFLSPSRRIIWRRTKELPLMDDLT